MIDYTSLRCTLWLDWSLYVEYTQDMMAEMRNVL